jgi:hypothetical protein
LELSSHYATIWLCQEFGVSRSGYYKWIRRKDKPDYSEIQKSEIISMIREIHSEKPSFGYRRIRNRILTDTGWYICLPRVLAYMWAAGHSVESKKEKALGRSRKVSSYLSEYSCPPISFTDTLTKSCNRYYRVLLAWQKMLFYLLSGFVQQRDAFLESWLPRGSALYSEALKRISSNPSKSFCTENYPPHRSGIAVLLSGFYHAAETQRYYSKHVLSRDSSRQCGHRKFLWLV